jgi:uncharacterized damage-inducible protein DinB
MSRRAIQSDSDPCDLFLEIWAANERMNQLIIEDLDPRAWRAKLPGRNVRAIAAIFTHVHNIRRKWLRLSAPHLRIPKELDRSRATPKQVKAAFAESAKCCSEMLANALAPTPTRITRFRRDGWAPSWPGGPAMLVYMFAHEAHHRGQVLMLAHQLGFPLPAAYRLWNWEKLWKECGFKNRPR